jgi:hypothetical protein
MKRQRKGGEKRKNEYNSDEYDSDSDSDSDPDSDPEFDSENDISKRLNKENVKLNIKIEKETFKKNEYEKQLSKSNYHLKTYYTQNSREYDEDELKDHKVPSEKMLKQKIVELEEDIQIQNNRIVGLKKNFFTPGRIKKYIKNENNSEKQRKRPKNYQEYTPHINYPSDYVLRDSDYHEDHEYK